MSDQYGMNVPPQWVGEDVTTLAYQIAGVVSVVFMKRMPDLVMPEKEITGAIAAVLMSDPRPECEGVSNHE